MPAKILSIKILLLGPTPLELLILERTALRTRNFMKSDSSFDENVFNLKIDKRYSFSSNFFSPDIALKFVIGVRVSKYLFEKQL